MAAYPNAKVLLTLHPRGAEAWYESTLDTIYFTETLWQFKILELLRSGERSATCPASISVHTATFYVAAILEKLGVDTRTKAVTKAAQRGIVMR